MFTIWIDGNSSHSAIICIVRQSKSCRDVHNDTGMHYIDIRINNCMSAIEAGIDQTLKIPKICARVVSSNKNPREKVIFKGAYLTASPNVIRVLLHRFKLNNSQS